VVPTAIVRDLSWVKRAAILQPWARAPQPRDGELTHADPRSKLVGAMSSQRLDPHRDLVTLRDRMNELFEDSVLDATGGATSGGPAWQPPVDLYRTDAGVELWAELPGIDPAALRVSFADGQLTLEGERGRAHRTTGGQYEQVERAQGRFTRRFAVQEAIDAARIRATYVDGVVRVVLPHAAAGAAAASGPVVVALEP
jgi:HSP20 family protein